MAKRRALLVCAALAVAACGTDSGADAGKSTASLHRKPAAGDPAKAQTREQQTAGMVLAASPSRSADIAELKFDIATRPEAGKELQVELALLPSTDAPTVTLELNPSDGLTLVAEDAATTFTDVTRAHVYRKSIAITPGGEGVFFLGVLATFKTPDFTDSRSFTIPIIVEPALAAPKVVSTPGAAGSAGKPATGNTAPRPKH